MTGKWLNTNVYRNCFLHRSNLLLADPRVTWYDLHYPFCFICHVPLKKQQQQKYINKKHNDTNTRLLDATSSETISPEFLEKWSSQKWIHVSDFQKDVHEELWNNFIFGKSKDLKILNKFDDFLTTQFRLSYYGLRFPVMLISQCFSSQRCSKGNARKKWVNIDLEHVQKQPPEVLYRKRCS